MSRRITTDAPPITRAGRLGVPTERIPAGYAAAGPAGEVWRSNYGWVESLWTDVVVPEHGRRWVVATLYQGDVFLRDARALMLLQQELQRRNRRDVDYRFVRAWMRSDESPPPHTSLIFVGRPKPFGESGYAPFASALERGMLGQFEDIDGTTGNTVVYRGQRFSRHELEVPPEARYRRCDLDYGILAFRTVVVDDERHRVVAIAGLSAIGTLGLMHIVTDDARRSELLGQIRKIAEWDESLRPWESWEVCVRILVPDERHLANFLNEPRFLFRAEAIAVAGREEAFVREATEADLQLTPERGGGGIAVFDGLGKARLPEAQFGLLRYVAEQLGDTSMLGLCRGLGIWHGSEGEKLPDVARNNLTKRVFDLNSNLMQQIPRLRNKRVVVFRKARGEQRYVLATQRLDPSPGGAGGRSRKP